MESHLREKHTGENESTGVLSQLDKFAAELKKLSKACFSDSEIVELSSK